MYVGLKQPRGEGERCVTSARAATKETRLQQAGPGSEIGLKPERETAVRALLKGRDVLAVTVLERRDFVIVREDFKNVLHRFTREFQGSVNIPFYYSTAFSRVQITPKTSTNIPRYLYSRRPV